MQDESQKITKACLSIGLASAWAAAPSEADVTFVGSVTPTVDIDNAVIYYGNNVSTAGVAQLGSLTAGVTTEFTHTFFTDDLRPNSADWVTDPNSYEGDSNPAFIFGRLQPGYAFVGTYDDGGNLGVVVSFPDDSPIVAGSTFEETFNTDSSFDPTEQQFLDALLAVPSAFTLEDSFFLDINSLIQGVQDLILTPYGLETNLIAFSTAGPAGTITIVVPEPASIGVVLCGAGSLLLRGRRRPDA